MMAPVALRFTRVRPADLSTTLRWLGTWRMARRYWRSGLSADVEIDDNGLESGFRVPGVGEARGTRLKNPVTGEPHGVAIVLDEGFIWKRGDCGQGTFDVDAEGMHLSFEDSNWILYDFDWSNEE